VAGTLENPVIGEKNSTGDPKIVALVKLFNERLNAENKLGWYAPSIIGTEQTRESASFGTLTTADEVKSVILPENGIIVLGYLAKWKSSVSGAGRAAIFLGANQLKTNNEAVAAEEATLSSTSFHTLGSSGTVTGLDRRTVVEATFPTTGSTVGQGVAYIFAAAGTYNISIQFRATSGSVTAKERKLWVSVLGY
jgi:hypothetical protein